MIKWLIENIFDKIKQYFKNPIVFSDLDNQKIKAKTDSLNHGLASPVWNDLPSLYAITIVEAKKNALNGEDIGFNPSTGIILKVFLNTESGELRMFPAKMFEKK